MPARRVTTPDKPLAVKDVDVRRIEEQLYNNLQYIHDMGDPETAWMAYRLCNDILRQGVGCIATGGNPGNFRVIYDRIEPAVTSPRR